MIIPGRILAWIVTASTIVGAAAVLVMMLLIVADVTLKNLINMPIPATSIIVANFCMIIVAYLPLGLAEKLDGHISVELVFRHLGERWRRVVLGIVWLFSAVLVFAIAHHLWFEAMKKANYGAYIFENDLQVPIWPSYFVLPFGFGLMGLILLYRFARAVTGLSSGLGETDPDDEAAHLQTGGEA